jgi:hypothetical protein
MGMSKGLIGCDTSARRLTLCLLHHISHSTDFVPDDHVGDINRRQATLSSPLITVKTSHLPKFHFSLSAP